jgi:hypothetical protein
MNWKVVVPIIVVVVLILVVPVVMKKGSAPETAPDTSGATAAPPQPAAAPPLLDAASLTGSVWKVKTGDLPVALDLALNAGGQAVASVPGPLAMIAKQKIGSDTFTGTWSVEGATLNCSFQVGDKTQSFKAEIIGDKIYMDEKGVKKEMPRTK